MVDAKKTEQRYILQDVIEENESVRSYLFYYGLTPFQFSPGQFVVTRLGESGPFRASLSLSSSANDRDKFELTVKRTGDFGTHFFDNAQVGSLVLMTQPSGPFVLDAQDTSPICFVGCDYSIPSARSFLRTLRENQSNRPFVLIQELTAESEVLFGAEFKDPHYRHFSWKTVAKGGLTAEYLSKELLDPKVWSFYVQAEGVEAKTYQNVIRSLGVEPARLRVERWS